MHPHTPAAGSNAGSPTDIVQPMPPWASAVAAWSVTIQQDGLQSPGLCMQPKPDDHHLSTNYIECVYCLMKSSIMPVDAMNFRLDLQTCCLCQRALLPICLVPSQAIESSGIVSENILNGRITAHARRCFGTQPATLGFSGSAKKEMDVKGFSHRV